MFQRSQIKKIDQLENQGNELLTLLSFGGLSTETYKQITANLVQQARTDIQNSSAPLAQELSFNALAGFVQTLQETANKIEAKNNKNLDQELKKRKTSVPSPH